MDRLIYTAILALAEARRPFDALTVGDWIADQGKADIGYHFDSQPSRAFLPLVRLGR